MDAERQPSFPSRTLRLSRGTIVVHAPTGTVRQLLKHRGYTHNPVVGVIAFYEKVIKVKADVAAYLINCFPSV